MSNTECALYFCTILLTYHFLQMQQFANLITLTTKIKIYNFTKSSIQLLKIPQQLSRNTHHNPTSLSNSLYQKCEECVKSKLLVYAAFNSPLPSSRFNYQLKFVVISTKEGSCKVVYCNLLVFFFFFFWKCKGNYV